MARLVTAFGKSFSVMEQSTVGSGTLSGHQVEVNQEVWCGVMNGLDLKSTILPLESCGMKNIIPTEC